MLDLIPWRKKKKKKEAAEWEKGADLFFDRFTEDSFFAPMKALIGESVFPKVDVSEGKKNITVTAEMPGLEAKEIDVSIDGRSLTIKGEKKKEKEEKKESFYRMERSFGRFQRTFELPAEVDQAKVEASYKKGVLKIVLKKTREAETKTIKVKAM